MGGTQGGTHVNPVCSVANDSDPHFLTVPCWKITLFVIVPVLGPLVALIICYNWLHRRLAGAVLGQQTGPLSSSGASQPWVGNIKRVDGTRAQDSELEFPSCSVHMANSRLLRESMKRTTYWALWGPLVEREGAWLWIPQGGCGRS